MLGWLDYPGVYDREEFDKIKKTAIKVKNTSEILLVIGIGGSYIGARAAIEMLTHSFRNNLADNENAYPKIYFAGNNLSTAYIKDLIELLREKEFSINIISKSGTTLEPAITFRFFRKLLEDKYGKEEARSRIYVTTGQSGLLKRTADEEGYETFTIPENIGGRYSVLTAVGLFPIAVSGISIDEIMTGARAARIDLAERDLVKNASYQYAAIRNYFYKENKTIEILVNYEPGFRSFAEWWKQLFAESEGKEGMGIFPTSALYSTDLHSIGQYIQEGRRDIFETIIKVEKESKELIIQNEETDYENLNFLFGKSIDFVNDQVFAGAVHAHTEGGVPNLIIRIPDISPFTFGYIVYFFQKACAMSSCLLGVNPFDQPGVEAYKNRMLTLLK